MIPLRDDNPTLHTSFATYAIIGINVVIWFYFQRLGFEPALTRSVFKFGLIPAEILGIVEPGTRIQISPQLSFVFDSNPNYLTLLSSMFMHGGWFHIIGNMWFLAIFGDNVEDAMGTFRFIIFYLLCGFAAEIAQILSSPASTIPMVGASGAIGGVMGAYAMLYPRAPVHLLVFLGFFFFRIVVPAFLMLGYWFLLQILGAFPSLGSESGGVAFWAHIGGFVAGIFLVRVFCNEKRLADCRVKRGQMHGFMKRP